MGTTHQMSYASTDDKMTFLVRERMVAAVLGLIWGHATRIAILSDSDSDTEAITHTVIEC